MGKVIEFDLGALQLAIDVARLICSGSRADDIYNFGSSSSRANVKKGSWSGPTWWK